jgi:hypothetical protein
MAWSALTAIAGPRFGAVSARALQQAVDLDAEQ